MADEVAAALLAAGASLVVALVSGGFAIWNRLGTEKNTRELQDLKSEVDRDFERFRAQIAHKQTINAAQWEAEFAAYQAIWKGFVGVRPLADKLVNREAELQQIGLPEEYLNGEVRLHHRKDQTKQLLSAAQVLLSAIHDNAPFYPAPIREVANEAHRTTIRLATKNLVALAEAAKGNNITQTQDFLAECGTILIQLAEKIDAVESLIRGRLEAVQVVNSVDT